ncbi:hypothetical protein Patl1_04613 [Pistacia atlantica]|uniref:Uncharacterized protein n=1 Tax=Pistacia atlantica TaxID=434234 RepID=A0ACC1BVF6_9ROSI|nr:hypothetical protein Patl1_04613 [Pistacia atlantica]
MATTQNFASTCFFLLLCLSYSFAHRVLLNDGKIKQDRDGVINNDKEKIDSVDVINNDKEKIDSFDVINNDKEKIDGVDVMIEKADGNGSETGTGFVSGGTVFGSGNGTVFVSGGTVFVSGDGTGSAGGMGTGSVTSYGTNTGCGISNASTIEIDPAQPQNGGEIEFMPMPMPMARNPSSNSSNPRGEDGSHV